MKSIITNLVLAFCLTGAITSCKKDVAVVIPTVNYMAMLSGGSEVPAFTTTASGMLDAVYTPSTKVMTYTLTFSGTTPTAAHIHKGAVGTNGGVSFDFGTSLMNGMTGSFTLTSDQEMDLAAGMFYVNMHSAKSPSGEIRGQIMKK